MRLGTAVKMMPLHHSSKPASLAGSDHVHKALAFKNVDHHAIACFDTAIALGLSLVNLNGNFTQELHRRQIVLGEMSLHRFGHARFLHELNQAKLGGFVSIFSAGLRLRHHARTSLQNRCRTHLALRIEELRHPDFLS